MKKQMWQKVLTVFMILLLVTTMSPVAGQALAEEDPSDAPTTGFEDRDGESWTTHDEELAFLEEVAALSDRVTYTELGRTVEDRPLHLVRVGYPEPPSDEEIAEGRNMLTIGTQHGNEPAPREMTLQTLRNLAFTEDPELLDQMSETTFLFIPTANPDGREADTRQNADNIDINRQHLSLDTLESQYIGAVLDYFNPDIAIDAHERPRATGNPDMEMLWPRNLNVDEDVRGLSQEMVEDYLFPDVEDAGFSTGLYGSPGGAGGGEETILRNMLGLRNGIGLLTESAGSQDPTYRVDAQLATIEAVIDFYRERFDDVVDAVENAPDLQADRGAAASEPFYLDGADNWDPTNVLENKPSGYLLTNEQANEMETHLDLFSLESENVANQGIFVGMDQPHMAVVPYLFDARATNTEVEGIALYDSEDVGTAANMMNLVENLAADEELNDSRPLLMHLTAVDQFEQQGENAKVIRHLESFHLILEHQFDNEQMSEYAYENLSAYTDFIINKWEWSFDSNRAMQHISYLSETIGPRVAGSEAEVEAADYISNEFASLGYDVDVQEFEIRGGDISQNVIATMSPEDVEDPEIVYVGGHYDSVPGSPGANDNASGTSTVLELARIFQDVDTDKELRFIAFGAEEIGLVGSYYYVDQLSDDEIDRSLAYYNLDMVGTIWEPASQLYINPVDGDPENLVWQTSEAAAERIGLDEDTIFLNPFGRSDHVPFHNAGIDAALFIWMEPGTAGLEPWYHTPQDTFDKISPEKVQIVGDLINSAVSELLSEPASTNSILEDAS
ncbi:M28 family peptidase [Virgibacillus kimchii]